MDASLPKSRILRSKRDIEALFERGSSFVVFPLRVCCLRRETAGAADGSCAESPCGGTDAGAGGVAAVAGSIAAVTDGANIEGVANASGEGARVLVSVPKRFFRRAVKRNLLKRRIREAWRREAPLHNLGEIDIALLYIGKEAAQFRQIEGAVKEILARLSAEGKPGAETENDGAGAENTPETGIKDCGNG